MTKVDPYQAAGVDIDAGNAAASRYARLAKRTVRPEVIGGIGGFAGGFALDIQKYPSPVLISGADGVGTKLKVAFAANKHDTIGIDCVAMCVNDILTTGAEPLFFLDYLAVGKLDVEAAEAIVAGVAEGCAQSGCALIGGETAEMPDMYTDGEYDLAGTAVGVVNRPDIVDGNRIASGDAVIGLASNGVHSNGFSLVRKILRDNGISFGDTLPGWRGTVAEELLQPTRIYVKSVLALKNAGVDIKGMAHITGGGLIDNVPRCLPESLAAKIQVGSWQVPPVFEWLREQSDLSFEEANRIWNMGVGFVLVVSQQDVERAVEMLRRSGETPAVIGQIVEGPRAVVWGDAR
ncbi:phosphoribosylformylglycinamidine cyclo-ligase [Alicyclobacillus tolerans]|uniref:phosphoribosylformylglycinamidine cyclo-ligase n=1 Tax=Alicyclobacillus tolerans TaxID=90970 RepID=UPI001F012290|nr:phosphoribosylformylglycinamidine cyclo-ligase [Alicyclobacillus tolerans]MCF8566323.1 phosphoribosylformylglycinamidine cyclo-ligase [Alicyclobacillus tolerans]